MVQGFEERAERLALDITDANKRVRELGEKVGAKFEREDRFQELTRRQSEIEEKLDLNKNQAPSQVEADSTDAIEQKNSEKKIQTHSHRPDRRTSIHI
jgi:tRNA U34 5-carboxymethylaminomethyl modifying enzyme MnmG/GidA